jgi:hypothetical protein
LVSGELGFLSVPVQTSLMAAGAGGESEIQGVERLLSYADELVGVLCAGTDHDGIAQISTGARTLLSACRSESDDLELHPTVMCF